MALLKVGISQTLDFLKKAINALDETCKVVGVFLDLRKAFDCVNHTIIIFDRLYSLKVRGRSMEWIKYFLIGLLCLGLSNNKDIKFSLGMPQHSDFGPIFFIRIA